MAKELSRGLYASGFRSLERLELKSDARGGSVTRVIQALLRSVSQCPGMLSLDFRGSFYWDKSDTEAAEVEWRCLADAVAHTRKLSTLKADCEYEYNCNGCDILEGALRSESLKEIYLVGTSLLNSYDLSRQHLPFLHNNYTVKTLRD